MDESKSYLKKLFRVNKTVYCKLNHVSQSGMTRRISFYVVRKNKIIDLTRHISNVTGLKVSKNGGLTVGGCGMDMGFSVVYDLSRTLYPKGFRSSERNRSNGIKSTDKGYNWDSDGGYRLEHSWL